MTIEAMKQALEELKSLNGLKMTFLQTTSLSLVKEYVHEALRQAIEQPEDQPVAWISKHGVVYPLDEKDEVHPINELHPLYMRPQPAAWVGLTNEDIPDDQFGNLDFWYGIIWAAAQLKKKKKNT